MRTVGLKVLKNKLSEYVRLAARGERVLIADRDRVFAELVPPEQGRAETVADAVLASLVREGEVTPALLPPWTWAEPLVSSRLLEYELWSRVNARGDASTHGDAVRDLLARVSLVEVERRQRLTVASYDERQRSCARRLGLALADV